MVCVEIYLVRNMDQQTEIKRMRERPICDLKDNYDALQALAEIICKLEDKDLPTSKSEQIQSLEGLKHLFTTQWDMMANDRELPNKEIENKISEWVLKARKRIQACINNKYTESITDICKPSEQFTGNPWASVFDYRSFEKLFIELLDNPLDFASQMADSPNLLMEKQNNEKPRGNGQAQFDLSSLTKEEEKRFLYVSQYQPSTKDITAKFCITNNGWKSSREAINLKLNDCKIKYDRVNKLWDVAKI